MKRLDNTIARLVDDLADTWNRRDGASFGRLFAENADYVTGSGVRLTGRGQIRDALFTRAEGPVNYPISIVTQSLNMLGPDAAVMLCAWQIGSGDASGIDASPARSGFVTIVAQRARDGWQIIALQNTDRARSTEDQSDA